MDYQVKVKGMIIGSTNVGEYDKRLIILTLERGKIIVFAKGVRKPKSPHVAATGPFTFGIFTVYEGKEAYNLVDAEVLEYFMEIRNNLDNIYMGLYFLELCDYFVKENQREPNILKLLYRSIQMLCKDILDVNLIRSIFEIKILMLNGEAYITYECTKCHKTIDLVGISHKAYGCLCKDCIGESDDVTRYLDATIYTINYIYSCPPDKVFSFNVTDEVNKELRIFSKKYVARFVDRKFNSLQILKNA